MKLEKVAVIGAGTMGASIAIALTAKNFPVSLLEFDQNALEKGLAKIDHILAKSVEKGLSIQEAKFQRSLIVPKNSLRELADVDLVIEAVPEELSIKGNLFRELDKHCADDCILASNTSSISITRLAAFTKRNARVIGMHFFNPAHLMNLVEIIPGLSTSEETTQLAMQFCGSLDKLAVKVEDCPSFLVNRLLARYLNESLWLLNEGLASVEEIDETACRLLMPIGPLALRDMNGLDVGLAVAQTNYLAYGERFAAPPFLSEMVKAGMLGKKSSAGFYTYDKSGKKLGVNVAMLSIIDQLGSGESLSSNSQTGFNPNQLFLPMINEAFLVLQERIVRPNDLDPALKAGLRMRKGPLQFGFEMGLSNCLTQMEELFDKYGERFRPAPLLKRYAWAGRDSLV